MKVLSIAASRAQTLAKFDVLLADVGPPIKKEKRKLDVRQLATTIQELQPEVLVWAWGADTIPDLPFAGPQFACSGYDAALAGAFAGQPGFLLILESEGRCLLALREEHNQTRTFFNPEGSLSWLAELAAQNYRSPQLGGISRQRFARVLDRPLKAWPDASAQDIFRELQDLADFPGPDPAAKALMVKAGRALCDFCRAGRGRARLAAPIRASWAEYAMQGPLWDAFSAECKQYLPELRWQAPAGDAALGALLLWEGQRQEQLRLQALGREIPEVQTLDEEAWRHLKRGGRWLEPWKPGR